jgi:hypothetical protein
MSISAYEREIHAGREDEAFDTACIFDTLTLAQCERLCDGWKPELDLGVRDHDDRVALQLSQARAAVRNLITRGEKTLADVRRVAA